MEREDFSSEDDFTKKIRHRQVLSSSTLSFSSSSSSSSSSSYSTLSTHVLKAEGRIEKIDEILNDLVILDLNEDEESYVLLMMKALIAKRKLTKKIEPKPEPKKIENAHQREFEPKFVPKEIQLNHQVSHLKLTFIF